MQAQHITIAAGPRALSLRGSLMLLDDGDRLEFRPRRMLPTEFGPILCDPLLIVRWRSGRITELDVWEDDELDGIRRFLGS